MGTVCLSLEMGQVTYLMLLPCILGLVLSNKLQSTSGTFSARLGAGSTRRGVQLRGSESRLSTASSRLASGVRSVNNGVDFSGCVTDFETGFCCIEKLESVTSIEKEPILECTHKNVEQCHYTYVTQFRPSIQEICVENFEKLCQITFKQQAFNETVNHCYRPVEKVCNGQGPRECRTVYESSCSTKYVEKQPGKFVGDTSCEKLPIEICGRGCEFQEGEESCHEKVVASLVDVPEEVCDLNPQKTCRHVTKLVPSLKPEQQCTIVPKETCHLKHKTPEVVESPLLTRWCLDPTPPTPANLFDDSEIPVDPRGPITVPTVIETIIDKKPNAVEPPSGYLGPRTAPATIDIVTASKPRGFEPPTSYLGPLAY